MNKYTKFQLVGELEATITGKLLYLILLDITDEKNRIVIPQRRISEALGISKGTVSRNLRKLYFRGYIDIIPKFHDDGGRAPNEYALCEVRY